MKQFFRITIACLMALSVVALSTSVWAEPWSFGVMPDTQWTRSDTAGQNPNGVAVSIINQVNQQFINKGVKFVVQVGDLTENGNNADLTVRANAAQALYNAGIGFYPLRGNHEVSQTAANYLNTAFPQTTGSGGNVYGATNFSSPSANLTGLSYSFDYGNARFVLIDQFTPKDGKAANGTTYDMNNNAVSSQQSWIAGTLSSRSAGTHAFAFSHKNLMGQNHVDSLFGTDPSKNAADQNAFVGSLASNGVRYYISGHDHVHNRSIVTSPDGNSRVQQIISSSDSSKFYTPAALTNFAGQKGRETQIRQELYTPGYYIYTVDGPRVTAKYYADQTGNFKSDSNYPGTPGSTNGVTPQLSFVWKETFGYSLNGKEFLVGPGQSFTSVQDAIAAGNGFVGTSAWILGGANNNSAADYNGRSFTMDVNTGWTEKSGSLKSDILTLWGMQKTLGSEQTDIYTLSMKFTGLSADQMASGRWVLLTRDESGRWVSAVDENFGGTAHFVLGAWNSGYGLGTYGIDPDAGTAWAVVNHDSDFAVGQPVPVPASLLLFAPGLAGIAMMRRRIRP